MRNETERLNFESQSHLQDKDYIDLLCISKAAFDDMLKHVEGRVKPTPSRTMRTSLAIFLMELRKKESHRILSNLFNISKSGIRRSFKAIRSALINGTFVSENRAFQHVTKNHSLTYPLLTQTLFGDTTIDSPASDTCPGWDISISTTVSSSNSKSKEIWSVSYVILIHVHV